MLRRVAMQLRDVATTLAALIPGDNARTKTEVGDE
jgi:hypothetical protein